MSIRAANQLIRSAVAGPVLAGFMAATALPAVAAAATDVAMGDNGRSALEEIVVTAQKRTERMQDVPASISVLSADRLDDLHATKLTDYAAYLPGFQVDTTGTPGKSQLVLRGVSTGSLSSTNVGAYIDDSPLGSSGSFSNAGAYSLDLMPYDLQQVEVLRGPQGTLYGASTMGGLLKYVLRSPDLDVFEGRAGIDASSIESADDFSWGGRASINMPIVAGKVALRASYFQQHTAGFIDNAVTGEEDENDARQTGGRMALLWQVNDDVTFKLSALLQNIDADNNAVVALDAATMRPIHGDLTTVHPLPEPFGQRLRFYTATLNWKLGWADFTSASSYEKTHSRNRLDMSDAYSVLMPMYCASNPACVAANGTVTPGFTPFLTELHLDKFTQEFRLASQEGAKLQWLAGAFHTDEDSEMDQSMRALNRSGALVPVLDPLFLLDQPSTFREYAIFGDVTYAFTERFDTTAGVRWARNNQTFRQTNSGPLLNAGSVSGRSSENVVTYMFSPRFHVNEDTMIYARVASGYRPGSPNVSLPGVPPMVDADTLVNYEIGVKSEFMGRRGMIDVTVFYIDWDDIRVTARTPTGIGYGANGGTAESQGVELTTAYSPLDGLRLGLSAAYTDATLTQDIPSLRGRAGDRLPYTPEWSGSLTMDYEFPVLAQWTGRVGGGYRYVGERSSAVESSTLAVEADAYDVVDLTAGLSNDRWTLGVFARNLTDERAYLTPQLQTSALGSVLRVNAAVLQPRTVGLSADFRF